MRKGRREFQPAWGIALWAALGGAAPAGPPPPPRAVAAQAPAAGPTVRITVEVDWDVPTATPRPTGPPPVAELSTAEGRIVEVQAAPGSVAARRPDGSWSAGSGWRGRARARVEAPLGSDLAVQVAGQAFRTPLASLLEGPQRTAPKAGVEIGVERLAWDSIQVELAEGVDGAVEPGAAVPISVAFNVLTPEPARVDLLCQAELRPVGGGEPVWRHEWREAVDTDALDPPARPLVVAPRGPEGTYVLEIRTAWEPLGDPAGTRLGRWVRRRRNPAQTTSAARRMTLAVLAPDASPLPPLPTPLPLPAPSPPSKVEVVADLGAGVEVDAIDPTRPPGHRAWAAGRSPLEGPGRGAWRVPEPVAVDPTFRDRLRGWISREGAGLATLGAADASGLAWSAVGLRVAHPERPHRLTVTVLGGHPAALGVAMVAGGTGGAGAGAGGRGRVVLDSGVSAPPILEGGPPSTFSWPVWPDSEAPVLVLVNRGASAPVKIGPIFLTELVDLPPAPRPSGRSFGLHLAGPRALDRFGGSDPSGRVDPLARARNLAAYLAHCGASTAILPDGLADRANRRALQGQADEDPTGPDRLDVLLRVLARVGCDAWVDVAFDGPLPGLPPPDSAEAVAEGLVRVDRRGHPDGPNYQPIHPRVREAMARKAASAVAVAVAARSPRPVPAGILVRLGPGSTLPGGPDSGLDDATFARFVAWAFEPALAARVPGQGASDPVRFEARARYVEGAGRLPWLAWRAREVASTYTALARAVRSASPGAGLAVSTPALGADPAGDEARRIDLAGLGPGLAWRGVGLDLAEWPSGDGAPIVLRGAGLSTDDLGHDLATSPELDELVGARAARGALLGVDLAESEAAPGRPLRLLSAPMAEGPAGDEPFGHALAALDPPRVWVSASAASGQEERLRRFARAFAALPAPPIGPAPPRPASGVSARLGRSGDGSTLALANDTPYPILMEAILRAPADAAVDDLGRETRLDPERGAGTVRLVLELAPFGASAVRVGSPDVGLVSASPHLGPAVPDGMKAQYDDLLLALKRLDRPVDGDAPAAGAGGRGGPANPGFEPDSVQLAGTRPIAGVPGWEAERDPGSAEVDRDRPHSGRGSLRLDGRNGPAAVVGAPFRPEGRSALTIRAWFRADRPDAKVRLRIEGQSAGRPFVRQLDVPARVDWAETVVRASPLPDGGLDSARLRFELIGSGRLWVDDVAVAGDALGESERLNARRDLTAALSAYREHRYADFARLAGSHWSRAVSPAPEPASSPAPASIAGDRPAPIRR